MATLHKSGTAFADTDPNELIAAVIAGLDHPAPDTTRYVNGGQGWLSKTDEAGTVAFLDVMRYYDPAAPDASPESRRLSVSVTSDLGSVTIDSALGIQPDPITAEIPAPEDAARIVYSGLHRLTRNMPRVIQI